MRIIALLCLSLLCASCNQASKKNIVWHDQSGARHTVESSSKKDQAWVKTMRGGEGGDAAGASEPGSQQDDEFADYIDADVLASQGFQVDPVERFYTWIDETGYVRNSPMLPESPDAQAESAEPSRGLNYWRQLPPDKTWQCCDATRATEARDMEFGKTRKLFQRSNTGKLKREGDEYFYSLFRVNQNAGGNDYLTLRCYRESSDEESFCRVPELWLLGDDKKARFFTGELVVNFVKGDWKQHSHYEIPMAIPVGEGLLLLSLMPVENTSRNEWFIQQARDETQAN